MTETTSAWNLPLILILVPLCAAILGHFIKSWFSEQKKGWEKYEEERNKSQSDWMERIEKAVESLIASVKALEKEVFGKVAESEYKTDCKQIDLKLDDQGKRIVTLEVTVKGLRHNEP